MENIVEVEIQEKALENTLSVTLALRKKSMNDYFCEERQALSGE